MHYLGERHLVQTLTSHTRLSKIQAETQLGLQRVCMMLGRQAIWPVLEGVRDKSKSLRQ